MVSQVSTYTSGNTMMSAVNLFIRLRAHITCTCTDRQSIVYSLTYESDWLMDCTLQSIGLASPPPAVPFVRPGSAFRRPGPRSVSEMEMMNYLWQSVLR